MASVGTNILRKDGADKVAGRAKYIDDLSFPGMIYGRTIRSSIPRGRITDIRIDAIPAYVATPDATRQVAAVTSYKDGAAPYKPIPTVSFQALLGHIKRCVRKRVAKGEVTIVFHAAGLHW